MTTRLFVKNDTSTPVLTYITLGATAGCLQDVSKLTGISLAKISDLMGSFVLPPGPPIEIRAPGNLGLNGNLSFDTPPLNCATSQFPNGVVLAEFIINNGFQPNGQETVDISCVAGANAFVQMIMTAHDWTSNGGQIRNVTMIENGTKLDNTDRVGVFPYGCDNCTSSDNPPSCVGKQPQYTNKHPICNVQRLAGNNEDGSLIIVFKGFTPD